MAKIDKTKLTKEQWHTLRDKRRLEKETSRQLKEAPAIKTSAPIPERKKHGQLNSFVLGNGTSRKDVDLDKLYPLGPMYACNAVYRTFTPDYLIAVDVKMILEISKTKFQHKNEVWTNRNKAYDRIQGLNYFNPSKGWSSGPTALWLASKHGHRNIFILGFDYKGLKDGKSFNNLFADTPNYKNSRDGATFFGNWLRQTASVIREHKDINYIRVIQPDNYCPDELNNFENYSTMYVETFRSLFGI